MTNRSAIFAPIGLVALMALQGCSSFWKAREEFKAGWRSAYVIDADVGSRPVGALQLDCREGGRAGSGTQRFALLSYRDRGRWPVQAVLAVPRDALPLDVRRAYRVNVNECSLQWLIGP